MFNTLVRKVFGSRNERLLKRLHKTVTVINALEPSFVAIKDEKFTSKTEEFKNRLTEGIALDIILPEAFACVREAAKRTLNMRHFDVQLLGGMVLHHGKIAEMRTGEGKTLVATLAAYLNALTGKGVHIVTVNDYLAKRDAEWMRPIYEFLGLEVGVIVHGLEREEKKAAYNADITYGTNNEFGFDYLRDNMVFSPEERMQNDLNFAIVDEVDSILIDEARTPLIISGSDQDSSELYNTINRIIPKLKPQQSKEGPGDYSIDEKSRQAFLTESGHAVIEDLLIREDLLQPGTSLYDGTNINLMHHLYAALKAHTLFRRDVDYIVKDDQVIIVDEHTGRTMPGRRWSDGLHQAVEAKERVSIQNENQTLASITFQNYFRMYNKLAGMTGTADTEAFEFQQIYGLETVVMPTNKPNRRKDLPDLIYLSQEEKFEAIVKDVAECIARRQPVLVGTVSIETSEYVSNLLRNNYIPHNVLNAKHHEREAEIVAEAGRPGAVTIATNMAGRGTDIVLGGSLPTDASSIEKEEWLQRHNEVIQAGGLHIIGTERHESRRIDNQLRGRAGRQGDPGSTRFYLSVKDNLMRIFVSEGVSAVLNKLGMNKGEAITHPWVNRAIENAQRKVEGHNFDIRKQLLEFDDVANDQRKVIYKRRNDLMQSQDISEIINGILEDVVIEIVAEYIPPNSMEEQWDAAGLSKVLEHEFGIHMNIAGLLEAEPELNEETIKERIQAAFIENLRLKEQTIGFESMRQLEKTIMLNVLDNQWKEHLLVMDYMRQSIHLRGYAQKDPKQEYKREAFLLFTSLLNNIKREVIATLIKLQIKAEEDVKVIDEQWKSHEPQNLQFNHPAIGIATAETEPASEKAASQAPLPLARSQPKVGRNDACPCGSGKKYKVCHGKIG